jgi:hypothetical protein
MVKPRMVDKATGAVRVYLRLSDDASGSVFERERLFDLDEQFAERYGSGDPFEYDGHDIGEGFFTLYFYGDSADTIASTIMSALDAFGIPTGSYFIKRHGDVNAPEHRFPL